MIFVMTLCLVGMVSCEKSGRYVDVRFGVDVPGTKTVSKLLDELMPTDLDLADVVFTVGEQEVHVGDNIALLEGTYDVIGEYAPWMNGSGFGGHRVAETPAFIVADEVTVSAGDDEIWATADWNCWALIVETAEVESVMFDGQSVMMGSYSVGDLGVFFIEACQGSEWVFRMVPSSAEDKPTEWTIEADERARAGKWYMYHPDGRVQVIGGFGVDLPDWSQGVVE